MTQKLRARLKGIESYFPEKVLSNEELEKMVDTNSEWIIERTGIKERRISKQEETPGFMGALCAERLLKRFEIAPEKIDIILLATVTGDYIFPASACVVQAKIGAVNAWAYDISAACSGYIFALETARSFVESGMAKNVLLIAAEKMSAILNYEDRNTCVLFGDAGSASLITQAEDDDSFILGGVMHTDGTALEMLYAPNGGSLRPLDQERFDERKHFVQQEGRSVYKRAVTEMSNVCLEALEKYSVSSADIKLFVPHQANLRIIESVADKLNFPMEKVAVNIDRYGNTTAATIPTALDEAIKEKRVSKGDLVLLGTFGAGFTWGASLLRI